MLFSKPHTPSTPHAGDAPAAPAAHRGTTSNSEKSVAEDADADADADDDPYVKRADGGVPDTLATDLAATNALAASLLRGLSWLDRLLSLFIIAAMVLGVGIGFAVPDIEARLSSATLNGVSAPLAVGLIVMMTPILTKVQYERLPALLRTRRIWSQITLSLLLNWIAGPLLMLGLAWAAMPEKSLSAYRTGVILLAPCRCIAMVMIWNKMARGDTNVCALLVIINSALQIVLYAPLAVLFVNIISDADNLGMQYADCAISVLIYLGIPVLAGIIIRFGLLATTSRSFFHTRFLPYYTPLSLLSLLFVIIIIFASQARAILDHIGAVFRTVVPLVLYFSLMWGGTFLLVWRLSLRYGAKTWGYQMAVVQAFTAGSNNFELAIAIAVSVYGANSRQALAATIGPLVEVPVLLILSWVALFLGRRMRWDNTHTPHTLSDLEIQARLAQRCASGAGAGVGVGAAAVPALASTPAEHGADDVLAEKQHHDAEKEAESEQGRSSSPAESHARPSLEKSA